jgi:hypothetical protein
MKAVVTVTLDNGVLSYVANVGANDAIAILETAKFAVIRGALGGEPGRPPGEPAAPVSGGRRAPGLAVRRVDG